MRIVCLLFIYLHILYKNHYVQEDGTLLAEGLEHLTLSDEGGAAEESTDESPMSTAAVDKGLTVLKRIVGRYICYLIEFSEM